MRLYLTSKPEEHRGMEADIPYNGFLKAGK